MTLIAAFNVLQHGTLKETLATFGVQAGHNFQLQKVVLGIHGDFGSLDFNESNRETGFWQGPESPITKDVSLKTDWMATLRGRFGFLPSDNLMIFVSGGLAVTEVDFDHRSNLTVTERLITISIESDISKTETLWGWTFGTGVEWALSDRWSFGAEYLHADFGTISATARFVGTG